MAEAQQARHVAVLNAGTGTVKAARFRVGAGGSAILGRATLRRERGGTPFAALCEEALARVGVPSEAVDAVGHRVVHGGTRFRDPTLVDAPVEEALDALSALAPLHNPPALEGIRVARRLLPGRPMVAVFDTAFHAGRAPESMRYALPWELAEELQILRYGFHGIAHASLAEALARDQEGPLDEVVAVTLQLGAGCSAAAVDGGRSVETSMGFTPLEGLVMASRCGDLDPGVVLQLLRSGRSLEEVEALLNRRSGLRGLAGSGDVREVLAAEARGDARARVALALFVRRIVTTVGAYLTLLGGRGAVVFGGGIGTHSAEIRLRVAAGLDAWNVALDPEANASGAPGRISRRGSRDVYVFETDEESRIAQSVRDLLFESAEGHRGARP